MLARKAGSISRGEVLAGWLHRVAGRAALRVRADRVRRASREQPGIEQLPASAAADDSELARVLDEEIGRLPARHRSAFVLCYLEGKTGEAAARLLGCPPGTVSSRLTRARERLRDRLTRRGFAPAAVAVALGAESLLALPVARLLDSTLHAALAFAAGWPSAGPPGRPAALAEGVIRAMTLSKLRLVPLVLVAGMLAAGAVVLAGSRPADDPDQPGPKAAARDDAGPVVRLVRPQPGGPDRVSRYNCLAEAAEQVNLSAGAAGVLVAVKADLGDRVKKGQVLAEIDARALMIEERQAAVGVKQAEGLLREAEAHVAAARAEVEAAKRVIRQREAEVRSAEANVSARRKQVERLKQVIKQGAAGADLLDEPEHQLRLAQAQAEAAAGGVENAKADLAVREGKLVQASAAVGTAKANVEAAQLGLEKARLALDHTKVVSPIDGVVTRRTGSPGEVVRPGEPAARGPLFTVVRTDVVRVAVDVPQQDIAGVGPGTPVELSFGGAKPWLQTSGKVARTGFAVDPRTATMRAEIDVPNPDGKLRPGMYGEATLRLGKGSPDAFRVPRTAVLSVRLATSPPTDGVYVYRGGKARWTVVRTGQWGDQEVEILSGLTAEDRVVADPKGLTGDEVPVRAEPPK